MRNIPTFQSDGRLPISQLYTTYQRLVEEFGWRKKIIYKQKIILPEKKIELPIVVFSTPQQGQAFWIIAGIHGEEPAGPNAVADNIEIIGRSGQQFPMVLWPLCNPLGYVKNWRYSNEPKDWRKGISVGDATHILPKLDNTFQPRTNRPAGPEAQALMKEILAISSTYPPFIVIDHHEDSEINNLYIYSQGALGIDDPVAHMVREILSQTTIPLQWTGATRFGETIKDGMVGRVHDGSIDELLATEKVIVEGKVIQGPSACTVIVIETPTIGKLLEQRINVHAAIIRSVEDLFEIARK